VLYIVATPIGNLAEITFRAVEVLNNVCYILCEDTRNSIKLLNHYSIKKQLISYHKFNEKERLDTVITHLKEGKDIALISDSGMPCVSDPGNILINECIAQDLPYTVISGASALINAFVLSGYNPPFSFLGFLPAKLKDGKKLLTIYKNVSGCLIFYLSPHNIEKIFEFLFNELGDRKCFVAREISKKFEEGAHTTLKLGYDGKVKGEFVLVVEGKNENTYDFSIKEHVEKLISEGCEKNSAIKQVAELRNVKKSEVYKLMIESDN